LICAGGTGGGVYPALAVLEALKELLPPTALHVLWVGGEGGMEQELVTRAGLPYRAVPAAGVHGVGWRRLPANLWQLLRGYGAARRVVREFQPDVLFFTGGYVAVPVGLAARGRPMLLTVPDIEPGLALKVLARMASCITVPVEDSRRYFPARKSVHVTGYPVRRALRQWDRAAARARLNLEADAPVLLVFGGSKGARSINQALLANLEALLAEAQVVHISGSLDWPHVEARERALPEALRRRYHPFPYLHEEMGAALAAADLALSRAGASILGEFPLFGLPAILVPYPHAWRYQKVNAEYLVRQGAAVWIEDAHLPQKLLPETLALLRDAGRRQQMAARMRTLARPQAAEEIARLLCSLQEQSP